MQGIKLILYVWAMALSVICGSSLLDYFINDEHYHFGSEVAGWIYKTSSHYLYFNALVFALTLFSLILTSGNKIKSSGMVLLISILLIIATIPTK